MLSHIFLGIPYTAEECFPLYKPLLAVGYRYIPVPVCMLYSVVDYPIYIRVVGRAYVVQYSMLCIDLRLH
jgi:hypothetical protein